MYEDYLTRALVGIIKLKPRYKGKLKQVNEKLGFSEDGK